MPNVKEKSKRRVTFKDKVDIICKIVGAFSVLISAITLITTLYPQMIPGNDNLLNKANAGHAKSQMLLAEHYFEIGEYEDSIYWFKTASANDGKYKAVACNNLGYLYAEGFGFPEDEIDGFYRYERALMLFAEAYEVGLQNNCNYVTDISRHNGLDTLRYYSDEYFPGKEDYEGTMLEWKDEAISMRVVVSYEYKSFNIYKGRSYWDGNILYTYSGAYKDLSGTYYKYFGQTYKPNTEAYDPVFIFLFDLTDK